MRFNSKILFTLLGVVAILFLLSIIFLSTGSDEAILAEQAYWFSKLGYVKSQLFTGMGQGWEFQQLHYHKLFIWTGALFIEFFGFSIYSLKIIPLLFLLSFIWLFKKYFEYEQMDKYFLFALVLLLVNAYIFVFSTVYRPEIILMTFGFLSYFLLDKAHDRKDHKLFIIAGIMAGICPLWHLNGLMFLCAGGVLLLYQREWKGLVLFSISGLLFFSIYFLDILLQDKLSTFFSQLLNDPNLKGDTQSVIYPINKIFYEHKRIFRSFKEGSFTIIPVLALIFNFRFMIKKHAGIILYTVTLIIFLAMVAHGIRPLYSQLYYPFFILIFIYSFYNPNLKDFYKKTMAFVLVFYVVVQLVYINGYIIWGHHILERNEKISEHLDPGKTKILTTESFVFNNLSEYDINGLLGYRYGWIYRDLNLNTLPVYDLFNFARQYDRDYIIVDLLYDHFSIPEHILYSRLSVGDNVAGYKVIAKQNEYIIFEKL